MATKTRAELLNQIDGLCDQAGCNDKIRELHRAQFVDRRWNPHPPQKFDLWWRTQPDCQWIDWVRAYNTHRYIEKYMEAKSVGAA